MSISSDYVNGVIAVKENALLGGRILKMCEVSAEEAFRILTEAGFARGTEVDSVYAYEQLLEADERDIDKFIRDYSPSKAVNEYFFSPRDYHNAKALIKAEKTAADAQKLLAPEGMYKIDDLRLAVRGEGGGIDEGLNGAIQGALKLFEDATPSGAEVGALFEKALYAHLYSACKKSPLLKKFILQRADMLNILTVMRSSSRSHAEGALIPVGKLKSEELLGIFCDDENKAEGALDKTYLKDFWRACYKAKSKGLPQTDAERKLHGLEESFLKENKYELKRSEPFLYYVFKRRAENANVRIVLSCLIAGMDAEGIKTRLREFG